MSKKILVIPDLHGKDNWRGAVADLDYDHVVFIGDYVDSFEYSLKQELHNLTSILEFAKDNPKVTLLIGNHDAHYMPFMNVPRGTGWSQTAKDQYSPIFNEHKGLFKLAYQMGDVLFTHAGVSKGWADGYEDLWQGHAEGATLADILNLNMTDEVMGDIAVTRGGTYQFGGPLWADRLETWGGLGVGDVTQVVGHSKVAKPTASGNMIYTDCLDYKERFVVLELEDGELESVKVYNPKFMEVVEEIEI